MKVLLKKIIILALIVLAAYFIYKNFLCPFLKTGESVSKSFYGEPDLPLQQLQEK